MRSILGLSWPPRRWLMIWAIRHSGTAGRTPSRIFLRTTKKGQFFQDKLDAAQWADLTHFEGNAQGFRILNRRGTHGLKLTSASLAAFTKYPRESLLTNIDKSRKSQKKYRFFQSEKETFIELAGITGLERFIYEGSVVGPSSAGFPGRSRR